MTGHLTRVALRWVDLDAQGHVNNAVVLDYLQEARVQFLLSGDNAHLLGSSTIVVAHQSLLFAAVWMRWTSSRRPNAAPPSASSSANH